MDEDLSDVKSPAQGQWAGYRYATPPGAGLPELTSGGLLGSRGVFDIHEFHLVGQSSQSQMCHCDR